jgi:hypothetical protein
MKTALSIEKVSLLATLGLAVAVCGLLLLKSAITLIILGPTAGQGGFVRFKGVLLKLIGLALLTLGLVIMFKSQQIASDVIIYIDRGLNFLSNLF